MRNETPLEMKWAQLAKALAPRTPLLLLCLGLVTWMMLTGVRADQVIMQNGDCYAGQVLSLTTNAVVFQSEVLGKITLPRQRVAQVTFSTNTPAKAAQWPAAAIKPANPVGNAPTNSDPELATLLRQLGSQTNLIQQVQAGYLDLAGPEAGKQFQQLLGGLATGRLSAADIRAEAKSAADQLRSYKQELGPDFSDAIDGYLAILDKFLQDSAPAPVRTREQSATVLQPKPGAAQRSR